MVRRLAQAEGRSYLTFDDPETLRQARENPMGFMANLQDRVALDEIQRIPELFAPIKLEIDNRRIENRFLLIGSANVLMDRKLPDTLAGRMSLVRMHPLAQCEIGGAGQEFLDLLFGDDLLKNAGAFDPVSPSEGDVSQHDRTVFGKEELHAKVCGGGYPPALAKTSLADRAEWGRFYCRLRHLEDIIDLKTTLARNTVPRLLKYFSSLTGMLLNMNSLGRKLSVNYKTIDSYITLLERMFLVKRLPPWREHEHQRAVHTPKLHMGDTGLACAILGLGPDELARKPELRGRMAETFVLQELRRQASWNEKPHSLLHFRDRDGVEVDIVVEKGDMIAGIEVKSGDRVTQSDFKGLRKLAKIAGDRFVAGVVLCNSRRAIPFSADPVLCAMPFSRLWRGR